MVKNFSITFLSQEKAENFSDVVKTKYLAQKEIHFSFEISFTLGIVNSAAVKLNA